MAQVPWELPLYLLPQTQHGTGEKPNFLHFSLTRTSPLFFSWWEELFVAVVRGGERKKMVKEKGSKGTGQNFLPEFLLWAEK